MLLENKVSAGMSLNNSQISSAKLIAIGDDNDIFTKHLLKSGLKKCRSNTGRLLFNNVNLISIGATTSLMNMI